MLDTFSSQRSIYKLIDALLRTSFSDSEQMLAALVEYLVDSEYLVMTGGRVWKLNAEADSYSLVFHYGELEDLNVGATRSFSEMPSSLDLATHATLSTEPLVIDGRSERVYSLTGVGELKNRSGVLVPEYALAFTAREQNELFVDTMLVVASAVTSALRSMTTSAQTQRLQRDLDHAWRIQRDLVPDHHRSFKNYEMYGVSVPDEIVGGDYFDYVQFANDSDRLGIVISDAASKGLPAAVQALFVSGALRMAATFDAKMSALVSRLNQLVYDTFPNEPFVTLFYAELMDSKTGLVLYVNAGHCPPMHYQAKTNTISQLMPTGGVLGIVRDQPFLVDSINLEPADRLVLYTDGITEAQNSQGELYGESRLQAIILENVSASAEHLTQLILDDVTQFASDAEYSDDKTLLVVAST